VALATHNFAEEAARAGLRVPDFFIVGHEKSGTTALYRLLAQHPQVFLPELKEPRFFVHDRVGAAARGEEPSKVPHHTLEGYLRLFEGARADQRVGEGSPQYIRSPEAPALIAELAPAARIVVLLREPVSFLRTYHLSCVRGLTETERDLRKAIALEDERRQGRCIPRDSPAPDKLFYREHVRYVEQLRRFEAAFGAENVLALIFEDMRRDNDATVRRVLRFLEVDEDFAFQPAGNTRERTAVRFPLLHRAALALQLAERKPAQATALARAADRLIPRSLRGAALRRLASRAVFSVPEPTDEQLVLELRRAFKPEVEALGEHLGRDMLGEWGYRDLD
jgi:hypothetical protein